MMEVGEMVSFARLPFLSLLNEDILSLQVKTHFDESSCIWTNGKG